MRRLLMALSLVLFGANVFAQDPVRIAGTITALNGRVIVPCSSSIGFTLSGTWSATASARISNDGGTTWKTVDILDWPRQIASTTANGTYAFTFATAELCAVEATAYASGTINVSMVRTYTAQLQNPRDGILPGDVELEVSASVAAAANNQTLAGAAGKRTHITGFSVTGAGATAASVITITITGLTDTLEYKIVVPAGVTTTITPLIVEFARPIPASADNTAIVVNVPSFGAGNTAASASAQGFQR